MPSTREMSNTVAVEDLRVGMFVHLDLGWMQHPFPVGSFRITHAHQIDRIRTLGLKQLRWCPERSELPTSDAGGTAADAPAPAPAAATAAALPMAAPCAADGCQRDFQQAGLACDSAFRDVVARPEQARACTEALSRTLLGKIRVDDDLCIRLLGQHSGEAASAHALNVAVLSLLMGRTLGLPDDEMLDLGIGALLHDVGKIELPLRVWHADEGASADEVAAYRSHVARGVVHGKRMGLADGALLVLAQHHEHADGSGFPMRATQARISLLAGIVALVNRYDSLCNPRQPECALTPHEALSLLFSRARSHFDAGLLNTFIGMMGVYPAGSVVQLTDDRYALVTSVNSARRLKPLVLVHDPGRDGGQVQRLNLVHTPDLGIRRSVRSAQLPADALSSLAPCSRVSYFFEPAHASTAAHEQALAA